MDTLAAGAGSSPCACACARGTPLPVATGALLQAARDAGYNLRRASATSIGITLDETTTREDINALWGLFASGKTLPDFSRFEAGQALGVPAALVRQARARLLEQDDLPTRLRGLVAKNR